MGNKNSIDVVKLVVVTAIGAALYGFGGLLGIPVFANTTIKPAMAILGLFAAVYGPVVGFLVGFLGHWITDTFAGWGVWFSWVLGSGLVGLMIGLFPIITKNRVSKGLFAGKDICIFVVLSFVANFVGYMISAIIDYFLYKEPMNKVITQQLIVAAMNTIVIGIIGTALLLLIAKRANSNKNLTEDKSQK